MFIMGVIAQYEHKIIRNIVYEKKLTGIEQHKTGVAYTANMLFCLTGKSYVSAIRLLLKLPSPVFHLPQGLCAILCTLTV